MSEEIFYVKAANYTNGNNNYNFPGALVAAKYLVIDGKYVKDPNLTSSNTPNWVSNWKFMLYDGTGNPLPNQNVNGYLVVPADFDISSVAALANQMNEDIEGQASIEAGYVLAYDRLYGAVKRGGSLELQRTYNGQQNQAFVAAFTSAASFVLGYAGANSRIGGKVAIAGGGLYNRWSKLSNGKINTSGDWGNNPRNARSLELGASYGAADATTLGSSIRLRYANSDSSPGMIVEDGKAISISASRWRLTDHSYATVSYDYDYPGGRGLLSIVSYGQIVKRVILASEGIFEITISDAGSLTMSALNDNGSSTNIAISELGSSLNINGYNVEIPSGYQVQIFDNEVRVVPSAGGAGTSYFLDEDGAVSQIASISVAGDVTAGIDVATGQTYDFEQALSKYHISLAQNSASAQIGGLIGSSLGGVFAKGNEAKGIVYSSVLGEIGERLGASLVANQYGETVVSAATVGGLEVFGHDVAIRAAQATVGSISSWLSMELGEALGLKGFGAELFTTGASSVTNQVLSNLANVSVGPAKIFNGLNPEAVVSEEPVTSINWNLLGNAVGSFLGAKLGAMVVSPQTQAGVALSSVGAAVGGFALGVGASGSAASIAVGTYISGLLGGSAIGGSSVGAWMAFNVITPGIGVFIGFVLGALIGNLFGKKKPKIPSASAETVLQIPYARYELGTITVTNNGNRDLVTSMATTARDTLNGLIAMVAYTNSTANVSNLNGATTTQAYGHTANQIYVKINGVQTNFASADQAVEFGTLAAIRNTKIVGGDIFAKRVIARSPAADLTSLTGDLQIASDYRFYASNRDLVNSFITGAYATLTQWEQDFYGHPPHKLVIDKLQAHGVTALTTDELSLYNTYKPTIDKILGALGNQVLANPWIITLQRVSELGLDKWTPSDFYGGLQGFLSNFDPTGNGVTFETANFQWNGTFFDVSVAGGTEGLFSILPQASTDGRTVTINGLDKIAYTWVNAGAATSGNDYMEYRWSSAGVTLDDNHSEQRWVPPNYHIESDEGHYETITVSGGDDIFIGSQYNDALDGRSGWDWLDGQGGNDVLSGGAQNDVLLGGSGTDRMYGGDGDDYMAGGDGDDRFNDWNDPMNNAANGFLWGGAGNDTLVGGGGMDDAYGETGDDIFIVDQDGGAVWDWFEGGDGSDTASFERFTVGVTADMRGQNVIYGDGWSSIENITGSNLDDWFAGDTGANILKGGAGADRLHGWDGDDILEGGAGADWLDGGAGWDTLSYAGSSAGVYIDLTTGEAFFGDAEGDTWTNILGVRGSQLADQLKGDQWGDILEGLGGDDWLVATPGGGLFDGGDGKDFADFSEATAAVTLYLGFYTSTGQSSGSGSAGWANGMTFTSIEGVVGTAYADTLSAGDGDQTFVGGAGNDYLAGGAGADTYVFGRGDGFDIIDEDNTGWNVLSIGEGVTFDNLWIETLGTPTWLTVGIRGTSDSIRTINNFTVTANNKLKSIDMNGAGRLDIGLVTHAMAGEDNDDVLYGAAGRGDLIFGNNGNDVIYGVQTGYTDQTGDIIVGGLGNDTINTSGGDDQFAYDRAGKDINGNQIANIDTIFDVGGEDTLVFGSTVTAQDVIYQVVGNDLYIGAKDATNPALTASQVADHVKIVGGGVRWIETDPYGQPTGTTQINTVEYVIAGGTSIDLRKLDIAWTEQTYINYGNYYPIALDLDGDGLDLSTVESSSVVVQTALGALSKIAWVGPTDGFLAVDRNGDGAINTLSEISFVQDKPGATSDLEGLRTWDTNGDGVLDKSDKDFSKILLFVDANQNGRSTATELRTLEEAGIKAINLGGVGTGYTADMTTESFVQNTISFVWADGTEGQGYDVALARRLLGSEGLYAGEYQEEWGTLDEDGTLGQLLNDPKAAATAGRGVTDSGPVDTLGASYDEVKAAAQLDFSDHDRVDPDVVERWTKIDASQKAAWLSEQDSGMDGAENLPGLRAISAEQALANALADGAQAGEDLIGHGLAQAEVLVSTIQPGELAGSGQAAAGALDVTFGAASSLGGLAASQPLDEIVSANASMGQSRAWWRGETGGLTGAGSLAALLATMDQGVGQSAPDAVSVTDDPALLQQQLLLRQAMAGFGAQAGGSAAIWNRDAVQASALLAASSQTRSAAAFNPALVS